MAGAPASPIGGVARRRTPPLIFRIRRFLPRLRDIHRQNLQQKIRLLGIDLDPVAAAT
jgi:hypothetical protein